MVETLSCQFCKADFDGKHGIVVNVCLHRFCLNCIMYTIDKWEEFDLLCPYTDSEDIRCNYVIKKEQIQLLDIVELTEKYLSREIYVKQKNNEIKVCLDPQCEGFESCDETVKSFVCNMCQNLNCLMCQEIHTGETCEEHQAFKNNIYFVCPKCTFRNNVASVKCEACETPNPDFYDDKDLSNIIDLIDKGIIQPDNKPGDKVVGRPVVEQPVVIHEDVVIFNVENFLCPVCFVGYEAGEGVLLKACAHAMCKECLQNSVKASTVPEIKCPTCPGLIDQGEIRAIVDEETYEHYLNTSINLALAMMQNSFHCRTPDCIWWCEYEGGLVEITCLLCNNTQLIKEPTAGNEDTKTLYDELIAVGDAMNCPGCDGIIEKTVGCDFIQCYVCKTEICWVTRGPRWGPGGHGDTSGGCKCVFPAQKCHPECQNCH